jgi:hypothetical protein
VLREAATVLKTLESLEPPPILIEAARAIEELWRGSMSAANPPRRRRDIRRCNQLKEGKRCPLF